jgi:hypothetical protein
MAIDSQAANVMLGWELHSRPRWQNRADSATVASARCNFAVRGSGKPIYRSWAAFHYNKRLFTIISKLFPIPAKAETTGG